MGRPTVAGEGREDVWVRRMRRGRALLAGSTLVAALALGACQSEEAPPPASPTPTPSATTSTATPTASASPAPTETSTIPAAARENTPDGAEAFVRYFVSQSAQAWMKAEPDLVIALSDAACGSCANLAERAEELRDAGHRYQDAPIAVVSADALTGDDRRINVAAVIKQQRVDVVDEGGRVVSTDEADDLRRTFLLLWKGGQWVVGGIA